MKLENKTEIGYLYVDLEKGITNRKTELKENTFVDSFEEVIFFIHIISFDDLQLAARLFRSGEKKTNGNREVIS